ncbi:hypothetical protein [Salinibacter sp.]|uniref:hypothetical protein n=1 Tax=Salinibacter sp. TaxID=2065818 RepID=UPI0021E92E6E|nr:hypothetical protein [Salinibacter sp.]
MTARKLSLIIAVLGSSVLPPGLLFGQDAPAYLPAPVRSSFEAYARQAPERAFALGRNGWGTAHERSSLRAARDAALAYCHEHADRCVVIAENDEIVRPEDPFPDASGPSSASEPATRWSGSTVGLLAVVGLVVLVGGTVVAERYPLYLFSTGLSDVLRIRTNYAIVPVVFLYFLCMMPVFSRMAQWDFSTPLAWIGFSAPLLPGMLSVLYLRWRGRLSDRFNVNGRSTGPS